MPELLAPRMERYRAECASLLRAITPDNGYGAFELPGYLHRSQLCKQRHGENNAIFRTVTLMVGMVKGGCTRADLLAIVALLLSVVEELCPTSQVEVRAAILRATASDSSEDVCETHALLDPSRIDRAIEAKLLHIADELALIAAWRSPRHSTAQEWRPAA